MISLHPLITDVLIYCSALIGVFWGAFTDPRRGNGAFVSTRKMRVALAEVGAGLRQHSLSLFTEILTSLKGLGSSPGLSLTSGSERVSSIINNN